MPPPRRWYRDGSGEAIHFGGADRSGLWSVAKRRRLGFTQKETRKPQRGGPKQTKLDRGILRRHFKSVEPSSIPVMADESIHNPEDALSLIRQDAVDLINIKLMKCGGISEALRMIHTARSLGLKIMIGCMIESSLAVTAAAHLTPLVDAADLDGNLLLKDDPFEGAKVRDGKLILPTGPGLGVVRR